MSSTTLYVIERDGSLTEWTEYKNSHGSAPAIWWTLAAKYVPGVRQLGETDYSKRGFMDGDVYREVWQLANRGGMEEFERRACWTTYDRAAVRIEDVPLYADALAEFARVHGPDHARAGYVFHIDAMAEDLRKVFADSEAHAWRGVAWNQTSVAGTWHSQVPTDDVRRETLTERIQATMDNATLVDGSTMASVIADEIMDIIGEIQEGDDRVDDNVDTFGCTWLPGPGVDIIK
jgi:hypothetical protein